MPAAGEPHPPVAQLEAFGQGLLAEPEAAQVEEHLQRCMTCCNVLSGVTCDDTLARLARAACVSRQESDAQATVLGTTQTDLPAGTRSQASPQELRDSQSGATFDALAGLPVELRGHPKYAVQRQLGTGGMGTVWLAEHRLMKRRIALKVISARFTSDRMAVERFRQEVRAAAMLRHPNIVTAFDADQAGDVHFLVMEYVEGLSLAESVGRHGPLPAEAACSVIRQVCAGLSHAHRRGMVHRDIKPQNLMLDQDGTIRILDFGLARLAASGHPVSPVATTEVQLTAVGAVLGTPDYMSPEQATDAGSVDARSDLYSLGGTFFFLLAGRPPFAGCSFEQMLAGGLQSRIGVLRELRPDVSVAVLQLIRRMTADAAADRPSSADEVADTLDQIYLRGQSAGEKHSAGHPSGQNRRRTQAERRTSEPVDQRVRRMAGSEVRKKPISRTVSPRTEAPRRSATRQWSKWLTSTVGAAALFAVGAILLSRRNPEPVEDHVPAPSGVVLSEPAAPAAQSAAPAAQSAGIPRVSRPNAAGSRPRILFVVPATDFYWLDVGPLTRILTESGCDVVTASWDSPATVVNHAGPPVPISHRLAEVNPAEFQAVVIGGGPGILRLTESSREADDAERLVRQMSEAGCLITAFNAGPGVLAKMRLSAGQQMTGNPLMATKIRADYGVTLTNRVVEVSGRIITGRDNDLATVSQFAGAIVQQLNPGAAGTID